MIILFEENETSFQNLGLGLLKDARSCIVKETLNDSFELELQYPITGANFSKITLNRIILCPPNPYSEPQPFRIDSISKPINGIITVKAVHISYDMNGIVVGPINGSTPKLALDQIQNKTILPHNFKFYTDLVGTKTFKTSNYYNMRSLLMGSSESILETYKGEILFDKFNIYILAQRGSNKGASVRYAKNMKDINHEVNYERLYNGVYPYYHQETSETTTETSSDGFKQVYIVGTKPFQDGWLSYSPDGEPYHPVDESPVQIMTEGDYYNKVYSWNVGTQRYTEKIYNAMVNLIECVTGMIGMSDKPSWIYIDVTGLPNIVVKASEAGYFKLATDSDWTYHPKGEIVFQGFITNATEGLLMYYSEVIPSNTTVSETETVNVTHVELKDKIMWLDTDAAKAMKYDRILCLDLTSEFEETPDEEKLEAKAKEYIEKNKIGQYKYDTRVSFIDLSTTTEGTIYEKMESIELGDTVNVVYENLGIDIELRVISTTYNVLLNRYDAIDLGEKSEKISASSVQTGDNVSSLSNDVGYTDVTTVNKLIAKTITADLIQAKNAKLSKAQIEELQTARIKCTGIIEATQFELDTLIAKMLTADNAVIKQTLEAGTVKVKGDITVTSGSIKIESTESGTVFNVDRDGNVTANSVHITGGELNINDTFTVTPNGVLTAQGADIQGRIEAESGLIAKFNIESDTIEGETSNRIWSGQINTSNYVLVSPGYNAIITNLDSENAHDWAFAAGSNFGVDNQGNLYAKNAVISGTIEADLGRIAGFEITETNIHTIDKELGSDKSVYLSSSGEYSIIEDLDDNYHYWALVIDNLFGVTREGEIFAKSVDLTGKITATSGKIAGFEISDDTFKLVADNIEISPTKLSYGPHGEFTILPDGTVIIQNGNDPINPNYKSITLDSNGLIATAITVNNAVINQADINLGYIGGFTIGEEAIYKDISSFDAEGTASGVYLGPDGLRIGKNLKIYPDGRIMSGSRNYDESVNYSIGDYCIYLGSLYRCISTTSGAWDSSKWEEVSMRSFGVDDTGKLTASSAEIVGYITAESGYIGKPGEGFTITSKAIYNGFSDPDSSATDTGVYLGTDGIRLGKKVTQQKVVIFDDLTSNNSSTKSIYDSATNYIGAEFILTYDPKPYDRYISIREKESAEAADSTDDYVHYNDPYFEPIRAKTLIDSSTFNISKSEYIYLNVNSQSLWEYNESTHQYDFIGTRDSKLRLYYDQISVVGTRVSIDFFDNEEDWRNGNNPHPRATPLTLSADKTNISFDLDGTNSPFFRLKIEYGPDDITNCYIIQDNPIRVLLPANSSSIDFSAVKFNNIKLKFVTASQSSTPEVSNIKLTLKVLPGFLVTPDGMMNAYNAKIWGSFIGDVNITGGAIRIQNQDGTQVFEVTDQGYLSANGGYFGDEGSGFGIDGNSIMHGTTIGEDGSVLLCSGSLGYADIAGSGNINGWAITAGANFGVTSSGNLYAYNAHLSGYIEASSGTIGPYSISSDYISTGPTSMDSHIVGLYLGKTDGLQYVAGNSEIHAYYVKLLTSQTVHYKRSSGSIGTLDTGPCFQATRQDKEQFGWWFYHATYGARGIFFTGGDERGEDYGFGLAEIFCDGHLEITATDYGKLIGTWYNDSGNIITSDRDKKHDIEYLDDRYNKLFDDLKPVRFKYNDGTSNRYHIGLISQDVQESIKTADLTEKEFAAVCTHYDEETKEKTTGLRYSEFIALNILEIQKLKAKIAELENIINDMKNNN